MPRLDLTLPSQLALSFTLAATLTACPDLSPPQTDTGTDATSDPGTTGLTTTTAPSPFVGNAGFVYVGTRDNDLWAIDVPPLPAAQGTVAWRQKVCTDGDITTSPVIAPDGVVYTCSWRR